MGIQNYFAYNMLQNVGNSYNNVKFFDFSLILALQCPASCVSTFPEDRTQKYFSITLILSIENELEAFPITMYWMKPPL